MYAKEMTTRNEEQLVQGWGGKVITSTKNQINDAWFHVAFKKCHCLSI